MTYNGILDYESRNSSASWGVQSIQDKLSQAYIPLRIAYGYGLDIGLLNIYVGENDGTDGGLDTRYYRNNLPNAADDWLVGSNGNDLIFGDGGNDTIFSSGGSDVLYGGKGNDTYVIQNFGDGGQTRIEDKEGDNTIVFNGFALKYFVKKSGETVWEDLDKRFTAVKQGTDLLVTDTEEGNSILLNENFQSGDFGIRLLDLPAEPTEDTAPGPTSFWGTAPPNVAVSSTKTITTKVVSGPNGAYSYTQTPDPLPPTVTDNEILFKSEQVSSSTVTTGQGTPETTDDTSTTVTAGYLVTDTADRSVQNWYDYNQTARIFTPANGNLTVLEVATGPSLARDPRLVPIGDNDNAGRRSDPFLKHPPYAISKLAA